MTPPPSTKSRIAYVAGASMRPVEHAGGTGALSLHPLMPRLVRHGAAHGQASTPTGVTCRELS